MHSIFSRYEFRHALSGSLAIVAAVIAGHFIDDQQAFWAGLTALIVSQTTRGTPTRQSLHALFVMMVAVIFAAWLGQYVTQQTDMVLIASGLFLVCGGYIIVRQPENMRVTLLWLMPPLVFLIAVLWPLPKDGLLLDRLTQMLVGGGIGMLFVMLVLPVAPYTEFSKGVVPIINAMIEYSHELQACLLDKRDHSQALEKRVEAIERIMQSQQNQYPEWVFETGFNRGLRAGFRNVLVQLEYVTESYLSLDYHIRQPIDPALLADVSAEIAQVVKRNSDLLQLLRTFFAEGTIFSSDENFTSDITDIRNAMRTVLPGSIDLLDMSPDYVNLSALARDVIDIRELLLKLVAGLPVEQVVVTQQ